jgi:pSer/pThr/pTyr-binding forkhead associated (FHA) protein
MIRLEVVQGQDKGMAYETEEPQVLIGRADNASFLLSDSHLSGEHGLIFRDQANYVYRDLRSTNGSMLLRGQKRVLLDGSDRWEAGLRDGDRLLLGDATSPVIVLCKLQDEQLEQGDPKVIAKRGRNDLDEVEHKVEKSGDAARLYRALKVLRGGLEIDEVLNAVANAVLELVSRATHLSILLSDGEDERALRSGDRPRARGDRWRRPDHDEPSCLAARAQRAGGRARRERGRRARRQRVDHGRQHPLDDRRSALAR